MSRTNGKRPGKPLTRQRSSWLRLPDHLHLQVYGRRVHDGELRVFIATPDTVEREWHLSISHKYHAARPSGGGRYPTWDEIADARYQLTPHDIALVMILPEATDFIAIHDTTFHLHQIDRVDAQNVTSGDSAH